MARMYKFYAKVVKEKRDILLEPILSGEDSGRVIMLSRNSNIFKALKPKIDETAQISIKMVRNIKK